MAPITQNGVTPPVAKLTASPTAVWDTSTQEEHGGQTWASLGDRFICDFSVTTNAFGAPASAVAAAAGALDGIAHYPAADCRAALDALSEFCEFPASQMLLGNGASEHIELIMRAAPEGGFCASPYAAAYMEYARAAKVAGREKVASHREAAVSVVIHPNSPTGDCMELHELEAYVQEAAGIVVVDESFIAFHGPNWRAHSALNLLNGPLAEKVVVLFSWTKLWACPGLRIGSIACSPAWTKTIKRMQVPWSANSLAQAFLVAACSDADYMQRSWDTLPGWKREQEEGIRKLGWKVNELSPAWVPWVFFECPDEATAQRASDVAYQAGCPVRLCRSFGTPRCIRVGVRKPADQMVLQNAWEKEFL